MSNETLTNDTTTQNLNGLGKATNREKLPRVKNTCR